MTDSFTLGGLVRGNTITVSVTPNDGIRNGATVVDTATINVLYGDANQDGVVNGSDLGAVLANFNKTGMSWSQGDFNGDGTVNGADLGVVLANFNQSTLLSTADDTSEDDTPPTAAWNPDGVVLKISTATFVVTYSDPDDAVSLSTIGNGNLLVTGPSGFSQLATFVAATPNADGSPLTVTYQVNAPHGMWTAADAGTYTVAMQDNQVSDTAHNYVVGGAIGTFHVGQTFALAAPASLAYQAGQTISIPWIAGNVVVGSKISLCYDTDTTFNKNEHWIEVDGVAAANGSGTYSWNTTGVAPGTYYLAGYLWNGQNIFTTSHLTQPITITRSNPNTAFAVVSPTSGSYVSGALITISCSASDFASGSKISLCYDTDTTFNHNEKWIEIDKVTAASGTNTYVWNTSGVAAGTYYIAGYLYDGNQWYASHLTTAITITAASNSVKNLAAKNAVFANLADSLSNSVKDDWLYDI